MFQLGIISDEVSPDARRACELARTWGLELIELRTIGGRNILQLSEDDLRGLEAAVRENGLRVSGISSPVFKAPLDGVARSVAADFALPGSESLEAQIALLQRSLELCERFGAPVLRVFSFWREPWRESLAREVAGKIALAVAELPPSPVTIVVENEPVCTAGSGSELAALFAALREVAPPAVLERLAALWDPGNALAAGEEAFPSGYAALAGTPIRHVHLKDLDSLPGQAPHFVPVGEGRLDYEGQLRALIADGYRGPLVLEPHYKHPTLSQEQAAAAAVRALQALLARIGAPAAVAG